MQRCVQLFAKHDLVSLVGYVPEDVVVKTLIACQRPLSQPLTLDDCVDTMLRQHPSTHFMDSYAIRQLVLAAPQSVETLSAMRISPGRYLQRCAVVAASGEECVLMFTMQSRQASDPRPNRPTGRQPWYLVRVEGEPVYLEPPSVPSPEFPPESVVAAQLAALQRRDMGGAYGFTSPRGRAVAGSRHDFAEFLYSDVRYAPLVGHAGAGSVRRCHSQPETYVELVRVDGMDTGARLFCWVVSRQQEEGPWKDCWMVDCVTPIHDQRLLRALMLAP